MSYRDYIGLMARADGEAVPVSEGGNLTPAEAKRELIKRGYVIDSRQDGRTVWRDSYMDCRMRWWLAD